LRQQISDTSSSKSLFEVGQEIVNENGWTGLWTGLKPGLVLTVNPAITYGVFERVKGLVLAREGRVGGRLTVGESFWIGVTSKTLATVVTYPYIFVSRSLLVQPLPKSSKRMGFAMRGKRIGRMGGEG
jgi:adenine nucleotide transporter 17